MYKNYEFSAPALIFSVTPCTKYFLIYCVTVEVIVVFITKYQGTKKATKAPEKKRTKNKLFSFAVTVHFKLENVVSQETANSGFASNKLGSIWLVRSIRCVFERCIQLSNPRNVPRTGRWLSLNLIPICPAVSPGRVTNISVAYQDAWFARWHLGRHTDIIEDLYTVIPYKQHNRTEQSRFDEISRHPRTNSTGCILSPCYFRSISIYKARSWR